MKKLLILPYTLLIIPAVTHAQSVQNIFINIVDFVNEVLIPFLLGLGFLFFVINTIRYFVIEGNNEDGREKAKALAIYGVFAFIIIIVFWGIVNLLASSIGLDDCTQPTSDYYSQHFVGPNLPDCQ